MGKTTDIRAAVEDELIFDPLIDATGIAVRAMGGDVALNGAVPSYPQYLAAADAARRVGGVTNVSNHLKVILPPADYLDDEALTTIANNALTLNVALPASVTATAHDGNITLTGTVSYGAERDAAEVTVAWLIGVRNVKDNIEVAHDAGLVDPAVMVQSALDRHALIADDSDVLVETSGSTVTLSGHVRTWAEHDAALGAAWMAPGVYDVVDELVITG
jgi:osmotically-inducible protein OsmY